jgi:hypothetical protein
LGDLWLVGGASNVGCAVLREQGFSNDELRTLSLDIDPMADSSLKYYPLAGEGRNVATLSMHRLRCLFGIMACNVIVLLTAHGNLLSTSKRSLFNFFDP